MDKVSEWVKAKVKQGYSESDIRRALIDEGLDPSMIDVALGRKNPVKKDTKKARQALLMVVGAACFVIMALFGMLFLFGEDFEPQNAPPYAGSILFRDPGLGFVPSGSGFTYSRFSYVSSDMIISRVYMMGLNYTHTMFLVDDQLKKSYSSLRLEDSGESSFHGVDAKIMIYSLREGNSDKYVRNAFFDYGDYTLVASLRCNVADDEECRPLFLEILESVYAE